MKKKIIYFILLLICFMQFIKVYAAEDASSYNCIYTVASWNSSNGKCTIIFKGNKDSYDMSSSNCGPFSLDSNFQVSYFKKETTSGSGIYESTCPTLCKKVARNGRGAKTIGGNSSCTDINSLKAESSSTHGSGTFGKDESNIECIYTWSEGADTSKFSVSYNFDTNTVKISAISGDYVGCTTRSNMIKSDVAKEFFESIKNGTKTCTDLSGVNKVLQHHGSSSKFCEFFTSTNSVTGSGIGDGDGDDPDDSDDIEPNPGGGSGSAVLPNVGFGEDDTTCSELLGSSLTTIIKGLIVVLKIAGIIICIVSGMLAFIPAISSKDDAALKKAFDKLVKLLIICALILLFDTIINFISLITGFDMSCFV